MPWRIEDRDVADRQGRLGFLGRGFDATSSSSPNPEPEPRTPNLEPRNRNLEPRTPNPGTPEPNRTPNSEPRNPNPEPGTPNPEPRTANPEPNPGTRNPEPPIHLYSVALALASAHPTKIMFRSCAFATECSATPLCFAVRISARRGFLYLFLSIQRGQRPSSGVGRAR